MQETETPSVKRRVDWNLSRDLEKEADWKEVLELLHEILADVEAPRKKPNRECTD